MTIKVALAGAGAFGIKHLDAIKQIDGVEVVSLISRDLAKTQEVADQYGIGHVTTSTPSICLIASRCLIPKAPAPASATLIVMCSPG